MSKVYVTIGLPASGKSTWAKEFVMKNPNTKMVSKDDLRATLDNGKWSEANEKWVLKVRDSIILQAIADKKDIVVHDTNFGKNVARIESLIKGKAELIIRDFTDVPVETCIERDSRRQYPVGEKVIMKMWKTYLKPAVVAPEYVIGGKFVVICDLDGTIALMGSRNPYDASTCERDEINPVVDDILQNRDVIFVSGRSDDYRPETSRWLAKHGYGNFPLFMRFHNDNRDDRIVKQEIYEAEIKGIYNVLFVLDDRNKVVQMWRDNGLRCLQVAEGDF
jgi:predicted kinase